MTVNSIPQIPRYPQKWVMEKILQDGRHIILRPIKAEDETLLTAFVAKCDAEDLHQRLFSYIHSLPHNTASILTHVDYNHTMSFVAIDKNSGELLGMTHMVRDLNNSRAEYGVITRSDVKQHGIGSILTKLLINYAVTEGVDELFGQVMRDNTAMLKICEDLGVTITTDKEEPIYLMATLNLNRTKKFHL